jgi:serine/threonine protein kinase
VEPLTGDDPVEIAGYQLRARLGAGGMGRVYLAFTPAGRPVALKVVRPDLGDDADFRRRFRQEVDASRRVHGLYTAQVLDADPDASPPWLVTAYVPGPSLQQAVAAYGPMPEQTVFVLLAGVAEALAAIHAAGIVHRDLKPSNVLLAPDGPRVIDFGIARAADSTQLTGTGMLIGSPPFMAPEQVMAQAITPAADVFAVGAVAVFAATGRAAFGDGDSMGILYRVMHAEPDLSGCPPRLQEVVARCLAKDPAARPSPAEIIAACRAQPGGLAAGIAQSWLPPDMHAALAQHAAPSPPSLPPQAMPPQSTPSYPAATVTQGPYGHPARPVPMPPGGVAPVGYPTGGGPVPRPPFPGGPVPSPHGPLGPGTRPVRRGGLSRPMIAGGAFAAIGVAALAVVGALALGHHGGNTPTAAAGGAASTPATQAPAAARPSTRARAGRPPAIDPCLVGRWKDTGDVVSTMRAGHLVTGTGKGSSLQISADGVVRQQFAPETLTTVVNGTTVTEVFAGSSIVHATTRGSDLINGKAVLSPDAKYKLYTNGKYDLTVPITEPPGTQHYTCSPKSTLVLTQPGQVSTYAYEG